MWVTHESLASPAHLLHVLLLPQAFDALHTAIALQHEVIGLHRFCQLTRGEGLSIADVYELMGQLCQIHADRQLFEAYDMRGTVRYRNANWCANVEPCTIAKVTRCMYMHGEHAHACTCMGRRMQRRTAGSRKVPRVVLPLCLTIS